MRSLLVLSLAFAALAQGCSCASSTDASQVAAAPQGVTAEMVKLELLDQGTLTRKGLVQEYRITNNNGAAVYFVRPEPSFRDADTFYSPPFYELHEGEALSVYSYIAPESAVVDAGPYPYVLRRLGPGESFRGKIEIAGPLRFNPPYPPPVESALYPIDGFWIRRIQLTLGVLPCPSVDLKADAEGNTLDVSLHRAGIACGAARGRPIELQKLVTAERHIQFTGCWDNDPSRPRSVTCDQVEAEKR
jgi:hypothetical protein